MIDALQPALAALLARPENLQAAFAAAQARADRTCQSKPKPAPDARPISAAIACSATRTPAPLRGGGGV